MANQSTDLARWIQDRLVFLIHMAFKAVRRGSLPIVVALVAILVITALVLLAYLSLNLDLAMLTEELLINFVDVH
jgi:hypothetical protein